MRTSLLLLLSAALALPAVAQVGLPPAGGALAGPLAGPLGGVTGTIDRTVDQAAERVQRLDPAAPIRSVQALARDRVARLADFLRANRATVEPDDAGAPARRGVVLLLDPDPAALATVRSLGFAAQPAAAMDALGLAPVELAVPEGMSLAEALARLRAALPGRTLSSDALYFASGARNSGEGGKGSASATASAPVRTAIGLIDGGVADSIPVAARRGFAGEARPSDHGTAIAALLRGAGASRILSADVYGGNPAGGGALAIARALDWLAGERTRIVSISLVGPANPLLERALAAAGRQGMTIVAAVGNDGPAAPPAYPASYPGVIAVTGVDGRDRALIEAGRALHLDYAAPGADFSAPDARGRSRAVRGTSFAAPLVAARAAAAIDAGRSGAALRAALDGEARDLGRKGPDESYGRGLLCARCVRR